MGNIEMEKVKPEKYDFTNEKIERSLSAEAENDLD